MSFDVCVRRHRLVRNSYTSRQEKEWNRRDRNLDFRPDETEVVMSISLILLIVVILLLVGALPTWGYSSGWGYWPSGGLGLVLLILIILMVMGRI
jgi:membrane protein YdbS with pleckstrin-like domain